MKYKLSICLIILQFINIIVFAQKADDIVGIWLTAGKEPAKIQIYKSGERYYGKIIWLKYPAEDGKARVDKRNPDKGKRNQSIVGLIILKAFKFDGGDTWEDGDVYDPESGKTYSCTLALKDRSNLKVRGYVGISLFGRTEVWTRDF